MWCYELYPKCCSCGNLMLYFKIHFFLLAVVYNSRTYDAVALLD